MLILLNIYTLIGFNIFIYVFVNDIAQFYGEGVIKKL